MRNAQEPRRGNQETGFPGVSGVDGTKASAWRFMRWLHTRRMLAALMIALAGSTAAWAQIAVDGRYWSYDGRRVLLLGGWNHGHNPFIDHDTDNDKDKQGVSTPAQIEQAMDDLAAAGGNCLRCVLDPGMAAGIQGFDFCAKSGTQYDLNAMTGPFWTRIETFIAEARKRDIIVQIELWDRFDWIDGSWGAWPVSPWNPKIRRHRRDWPPHTARSPAIPSFTGCPDIPNMKRHQRPGSRSTTGSGVFRTSSSTSCSRSHCVTGTCSIA